VADLLKDDLGFPEVKTKGLDMEAPSDLLAAIAARAGLPVKTIERTTFAGNVPFLFERPYTAPVKEDIEYCSVLFEPTNPAPGSSSKLRQWFRKETMSKINGCRQCLADYPDCAVLLSWGLTVVSSCPIHGLMLEPGRKAGEGLNWVKEKAEAAPKLVCQLDRRSMAAVAEGFVQLPGGLISAAKWFRMLQTIFHELNGPLFSIEIEHFKWQMQLWAAAEYDQNDPFLVFKFDKSCALLIATAIDLMEKGELVPKGKDGQIFCGHEWSGENVGLVQSTSGSDTKAWQGETQQSELRRDGCEAVPW
jgi:hypothetical protein